MKIHKIVIKNIKNQFGFSYIEMLVVLIVASALAVNQIKTKGFESTDMIANGMVERVQRVQRASMRLYEDQNAWPMNGDALVTMGYLDAGEELDSFGNAFVIGVVGQDLSVSTDVQDQRYVSRVQGKLPRSSSSGTTVTTLIDRPGYEVAHNALYSLDGSKPLTGPMDANGQNITNAGTVNATSLIDGTTGYYIDPASISKLNEVEVDKLTLVANATVGGSCTTKSIGSTSTGDFVSCKSGVWKTPGNELPVGSIYTSISTANPSVTLGYGTWVAFGAGRVPVGQNTSDGSFDSMEEIGGAKTDSHILTLAEMPSHVHGYTGTQGNGWPDGSGDSGGSYVRGSEMDYEGLNAAHEHDIVQPYIVVKMWKRSL